ncbi:MAG: PorV/PorQ family protein [Ignavibacteriales bacterium]|nr:PorV/PorQ family protein [Ignavibacteriales bacterium]
MKLVNKILTIFLLICSVVFSQTNKKNGTAGFTFLEIPASSRAAGLGEAFIALSDVNSDAVFHNPAALGFTNRTHSLSVSYAPYLVDIKNYATSYAYKSPFGVFGIGLIMLDYGTMPRTIIEEGQKVFTSMGTFDANAIALSFGYSKTLTDKFSFGVQLKYVQEKIDVYKATNILLDAGMLYFTGISSLRIAATLQNFGTDSKFIHDTFKMPATLRIGLAMEVLGGYSEDYRFTLITEALHPTDSDEKINIGTEISWKEIVTLRGGYKFFYDEESYNFGVGINPQLSMPISLDFSYSDYGRLGDVTRFTLQLGIF